jgi:hypothetical protein
MFANNFVKQILSTSVFPFVADHVFVLLENLGSQAATDQILPVRFFPICCCCIGISHGEHPLLYRQKQYRAKRQFFVKIPTSYGRQAIKLNNLRTRSHFLAYRTFAGNNTKVDSAASHRQIVVVVIMKTSRPGIQINCLYPEYSRVKRVGVG